MPLAGLLAGLLSEKVEKRGDPEKNRKGYISVASLLSQILNISLVFTMKTEKSQSRKNAAFRDSTGSIREPGEEVGGGVNPSLQEGTCR